MTRYGRQSPGRCARLNAVAMIAGTYTCKFAPKSGQCDWEGGAGDVITAVLISCGVKLAVLDAASLTSIDEFISVNLLGLQSCAVPLSGDDVLRQNVELIGAR